MPTLRARATRAGPPAWISMCPAIPDWLLHQAGAMEPGRLNGRLDRDSGDRGADSLSGPMRLTTRSKDVALEGLSGDLRLEDENGTVEVGLHKPGNIQIDNRKGDVQVSIPPNTPIKVEARTHQGEIESDFEEIKVDNRDNQSI